MGLLACAITPPAQFGDSASDIDDPSRAEYRVQCHGEDDFSCAMVELPAPIGRRNTDELIAELSPRCDAAAKNACLLTGILAEHRRNHKVALDHYLRACELGSGRGCSRAGFVLLESQWGHYDLQRGLELLRRSCEEFEDGYGCGQLGANYEYGQGVQIDIARARSYYERGCAKLESGGGIGCLYLSELHTKGKDGMPIDDAEARRLLTEACDAKAEVACGGLAQMLVRDREFDRAAELAQSSCGRGAARGCTVYGLLLEKGMGVPLDRGAAVAMYEYACAIGDSLGCTYLATAHIAGWAENADPTFGRQIYERECSDGVTNACGWLATVMLMGLGGPLDVDGATKLAQEVCETKQGPRACMVFALVMINDPQSDADVARAIELLEFACDNGVSDSCGVLDEVKASR